MSSSDTTWLRELEKRPAVMVAVVAVTGDTTSVSTLRAETFDLDDADREVVAAIDTSDATMRVRTGDHDIVLPPDASRAVRQLLRDLGAGGAVHVIPDNADLTTQQAADLLGLSRTFLMRLLDQGTIPAHTVGSHRRVRAGDVVAYQRRREQRLAALDELIAADEAVGLTY